VPPTLLEKEQERIHQKGGALIENGGGNRFKRRFEEMKKKENDFLLQGDIFPGKGRRKEGVGMTGETLKERRGHRY